MKRAIDAFTIVWDPEVVTAEEYAELVVAIGDLVRAAGGFGIERIEIKVKPERAPEGTTWPLAESEES